ncbi:MAG: twin-arginine translocase subunit TatC [Candidatus Nanopelagicales bacterium]|jgi:sec-independent protein translocase protein TatC|nr:twin-arginine translocase subunit TatC [Candidatus Nanopelagicales bacterium]
MAGTDRSVAMPLNAHLRELRSRLLKSGIALALGMVVGWVYYTPIFDWISAPFNDVVTQARAEGREITLALTGVADPFVLQLQVAAVAGIILSSPIWLYQLWRFITPGLHRHERRWGFGFVLVATPLFAAGVWMAYSVLPVGLNLLFGFTPNGVANIVSVDRYLSFFLRMIMVFSIGFLAPLVLIALNMAGILTGKRLLGWWRWIIFVVFIFAAVATPTGDPINMALLATPILLLVTLAIIFSMLNDKRRARKRRREPDYSTLNDDEMSPLTLSEDE